LSPVNTHQHPFYHQSSWYRKLANLKIPNQDTLAGIARPRQPRDIPTPLEMVSNPRGKLLGPMTTLTAGVVSVLHAKMAKSL